MPSNADLIAKCHENQKIIMENHELIMKQAQVMIELQLAVQKTSLELTQVAVNNFQAMITGLEEVAK